MSNQCTANDSILPIKFGLLVTSKVASSSQVFCSFCAYQCWKERYSEHVETTDRAIEYRENILFMYIIKFNVALHPDQIFFAPGMSKSVVDVQLLKYIFGSFNMAQ